MRYKAFVRAFSAFVALTAVVALIAPLAGPVLDHHFAERQPDHLHLGAPGEHSHAFESQYHLHRHAPSTPDDSSLPIALYKSDASVAVTLAASPVHVDSESMRRFQPASVFILPPPLLSAARQLSPAPPDKPPAALPQYPADFPIHPSDTA